MENYRIRWTHAMACLLAAGGIAYQSAIIWEMLGDSVTLTTKLGVPLATISAAMLPVMAEAAWRSRQRGKAFLLGVPVLVLLAFVLPSGISRLGEAQQARIAAASHSADDLARIRADLDKANKLVTQADAWVATECSSGNGPRCKGVTYTLNQRRAYQAQLAGQIHDAKPVVKPWLPEWHSALLTMGLELAILAMLFYGLGPLTMDRMATASGNVVPFRRPEPQAITEEADVGTISDAELEDLRRLVKDKALRNCDLARVAQLSDGETSKRVAALEATGKVTKERVGREVWIKAA